MILVNKIISLLKRIISAPSLSTLFVFASASMLSTVISGIGGILQARWVGPEVLGQFTKYSILTSYLAVALVVVQDGLCRQFPYLIGRGKHDEAVAIASVAKTWYVLAMMIFCIIFIVLCIKSLIAKDYCSAIGWFGQIPVAVGLSYGIFLQTIYRRSLEFKQLSYNGLAASIVGFLSLLFVRAWGFAGLVLKVSSLNIVRVFLDARFIPLKIKMAWDWNTFIGLAKISIPLSLEGYVRTSFFTATFAYLVVHYCGTRNLGLYGIAAAFEGVAMVFVNSLIQIFDVKMANKYGETESVGKGVRYLLIPTLLGFVCSVLLAGILCVVIGPFIRAFVPKYIDSIPIVYVLSFAMPVSVLMLPTRLLRVALMYRSIFSMALIRVISLIALVYMVPNRIEWFAGCKVMAEFVAVLFGYLMIFGCMRNNLKIRRCHG